MAEIQNERYECTLKKVLKKLHTLGEAYRDGGVQGVWYKTRDFAFRHLNEYRMKKEVGVAAASGDNRACAYVPYASEYQENRAFPDVEPDVKALAFYLPQFHAFKENDAWWGKGFTEWVNTRKCNQPRFEGHYQPREPHADIGYYDLSDIRVMAQQARLAREHGLYGFCFYYYWFSGKRLMEKPVDMLLEHPEIDIPFCLCWANENWTRAWDGQMKSILIKQDYSDEDDERFILDMKKYIDDPRYIRIGGKPLIVVYNPGQIPSCARSFGKWREVARREGIGEILIWTCATANNSVKNLKIAPYVDAEVEFPPHNMWYKSIEVKELDLHGKSAMIHNYQQLVEIQEKKLGHPDDAPVPVHHACTMGWDNAARRENNWLTFYAYSLEHLYRWMRAVMKRAREDFAREERFVFINAWNEWAEGTYLEPDARYGYANINTISKALYDLPFEEETRVIDDRTPALDAVDFEAGHDQPRIAVHAHMYYTETLSDVMHALSVIPYRYDCYMSTDTQEKKTQIEAAWQKAGYAARLCVEVTPNRGRDVAPLLMQMGPVLSRYDYIGHVHSKRTVTGDYGDQWRTFNFRHLLGSREYVARIFSTFERERDLGMVFPQTYPAVALQVEWGGNRACCEKLLGDLGIHTPLSATPVFPVGNMFWARTSAVARMFNGGLTYDAFPEENGQKDATIAHAIERSWVYVARNAGYRYAPVFNNCVASDETLPQKKRLVLYAHYDKDNVICSGDVSMVRALSELGEVVFASNNQDLLQEEVRKIAPYVRRVCLRENKGYDFGAWREVLLSEGFGNLSAYDEIVLANNSVLGPVFPLARMFAQMEKRGVDFWGTYLFPYSQDGSYLGQRSIPEHLQSYFLVFSRKVVQSDAFIGFWRNMKAYDALIDVVKHCETRLTPVLAEAGFTYAAYIEESAKLSDWLKCGSVPYSYPDQMLLLGMPFYKKKAEAYMADRERIRLQNLLIRLDDRN